MTTLRARLRPFKKRIIFAVCLVLFFVYQGAHNNGEPAYTRANVERGVVEEVVSVSGTAHAIQTAELHFPTTGIIDSILVSEGDTVLYGKPLAILSHNDLKAEYQDAYASLLIAQADQEEALTGIRPEARELARTKVEIAEEDLARVTREHDERVENAYRTLLSTDLIAEPENKNTDAVAPEITGTYMCEEGVYTLDIYNSSTQFGYSFHLRGAETGTYAAYEDQFGPLGTCGLAIQFDADSSYGYSTWTVTMPNTQSASYVTNLSAYNLAKVTRENAIRQAEQALALARQSESLDLAELRTEARTREEARVLQAEARLARVSAFIDDHILKAPFEGVVSKINPVAGEVAGTDPVITMIANTTYKITALIPEIDITKIALDQKARITFDARTDDTLLATIVYVSPLAKTIDGVSYFETTLILDTPAPWLRGGLSADVDILIETYSDVLRIPTRFIKETEDGPTVLIQDGKKAKRVPITIHFTGNDGYTHIEGIEEGTIMLTE